jgi:hypothetical protein
MEAPQTRLHQRALPAPRHPAVPLASMSQTCAQEPPCRTPSAASTASHVRTASSTACNPWDPLSSKPAVDKASWHLWTTGTACDATRVQTDSTPPMSSDATAEASGRMNLIAQTAGHVHLDTRTPSPATAPPSTTPARWNVLIVSRGNTRHPNGTTCPSAWSAAVPTAKMAKCVHWSINTAPASRCAAARPLTTRHVQTAPRLHVHRGPRPTTQNVSRLQGHFHACRVRHPFPRSSSCLLPCPSSMACASMPRLASQSTTAAGYRARF